MIRVPETEGRSVGGRILLRLAARLALLRRALASARRLDQEARPTATNERVEPRPLEPRRPAARVSGLAVVLILGLGARVRLRAAAAAPPRKREPRQQQGSQLALRLGAQPAAPRPGRGAAVEHRAGRQLLRRLQRRLGARHHPVLLAVLAVRRLLGRSRAPALRRANDESAPPTGDQLPGPGALFQPSISRRVFEWRREHAEPQAGRQVNEPECQSQWTLSLLVIFVE